MPMASWHFTEPLSTLSHPDTQNIMSGNSKGLEQKGGNVLEQTAHGYTASESMYSSDISSIFTVQ